MSTKDKVNNLIMEGKWFRLAPRTRPFELETREIYVLPELHEWLMGCMKTAKMKDHQARVQIPLKDFIIGKQIDNCFFMKLLRSPTLDIWEIRVLGKYQYRIFGAFLYYDGFLATHIKDRNDIDKRDTFDREIEHVRKVWGKIFPCNSVSRLQGSFKDIVSNGKEC